MTTQKQKNFWKGKGTNENERKMTTQKHDMKKNNNKKKKTTNDAPKRKLTHTMTTQPSENKKQKNKNANQPSPVHQRSSRNVTMGGA